MAKRVGTKPTRKWAMVSRGYGNIHSLYDRRSEARAFVKNIGAADGSNKLYNFAGLWRIEPVMVTPIKRKAKS